MREVFFCVFALKNTPPPLVLGVSANKGWYSFCSTKEYPPLVSRVGSNKGGVFFSVNTLILCTFPDRNLNFDRPGLLSQML